MDEVLTHSTLPSSRRLAADVARRAIDIGPGPGRVLVAAVVARVRQWTEEALSTQIPPSSASSSSSSGERRTRERGCVCHGVCVLYLMHDMKNSDIGAAATKPPTDATRALQRLEGLVALLLTVVEEGGPLGTCY